MTDATERYNRRRCTALTNDGTRCSDAVIPGLDVCHRHLDQSDETLEGDTGQAGIPHRPPTGGRA